MARLSIKNSKLMIAFNKFSANHPKLAIGFNGAVQTLTNCEGLGFAPTAIGMGGGAGFGLFALLMGGISVLPATIGAVSLATGVALGIGIQGAREALNQLKTAKKINGREAEFFKRGPEWLQAANDSTITTMTSRAREELKDTKTNLKKRLPHGHAKKIGV